LGGASAMVRSPPSGGAASLPASGSRPTSTPSPSASSIVSVDCPATSMTTCDGIAPFPPTGYHGRDPPDLTAPGPTSHIGGPRPVPPCHDMRTVSPLAAAICSLGVAQAAPPARPAKPRPAPTDDDKAGPVTAGNAAERSTGK